MSMIAVTHTPAAAPAGPWLTPLRAILLVVAVAMLVGMVVLGHHVLTRAPSHPEPKAMTAGPACPTTGPTCLR